MSPSTTRNRNRPFLAFVILAAVFLFLMFGLPKLKGADIAAPVQSAYGKGAVTLAPFASARVVDSEFEFGGGLAVGYALSKHVTLEAETTSEGIDDSNWGDSLRDVAGNVKFYAPLGKSGLAPYAIGGYRRELINHENQLSAGLGLEYRTGNFLAFVDGRVVQGFEDDQDDIGKRGLIRAGLGLSF